MNNADAEIMLRRIASVIDRRLNMPRRDLKTLAEQVKQTAELVLAMLADAELEAKECAA